MVPMSKALEQIRELYDKMPKVACKGLCWNSCGPIDMSDAERSQITSLGYEIPVFTEERSQAWAAGAKDYCPALTFTARDGGIGCAVYQDRPLICRAWGVGEGNLACPHGCETTGTLTHQEVFALVAQSFQIGGHGDQNIDDESLLILDQILDDPELGPLMTRFMQGDKSLAPVLRDAIEQKKLDIEATHLLEGRPQES